MPTLTTIGYEAATVDTFLAALQSAQVELLVDVRAVAASRRPGFARTKLAANCEEAGIGYLHLRDLGTPAAGRIAARAGRHAEMREIFLQHMREPEAQDALESLVEIVRGGTRACLLCLEADPAHCHRSMVAAAVNELLPVRIVHLMP